MPTCRWMDSHGQNITDWTHRPSGGDLLESTHPQVPLWCRVSQLASAMWRRIRIAIISKAGSVYLLTSNHIQCATVCQSSLLLFVLIFLLHPSFSFYLPPPSSSPLPSFFSLSPSSLPFLLLLWFAFFSFYLPPLSSSPLPSFFSLSPSSTSIFPFLLFLLLLILLLFLFLLLLLLLL